MLPGVVMGKGGQVFEMLYRLSDLDEPKYVLVPSNNIVLLKVHSH